MLDVSCHQRLLSEYTFSKSTFSGKAALEILSEDGSVWSNGGCPIPNFVGALVVADKASASFTYGS